MRAFAYDRPSSEVAAIRAASMLAQLPEIQGRAPVEYLAGGTTLVDLMKLDVMRPAKVVDLGALAGAHDTISVSPDGVRLGAMVKMSPPPTIRRSSKPIPSFPKACSRLRARNFATWRRLAAMCFSGPGVRIFAMRPGPHATNAILARAAPHWTV
jgi:xanthine dehydrogenase YagS FAD-binding subunit